MSTGRALRRLVGVIVAIVVIQQLIRSGVGLISSRKPEPPACSSALDAVEAARQAARNASDLMRSDAPMSDVEAAVAQVEAADGGLSGAASVPLNDCHETTREAIDESATKLKVEKRELFEAQRAYVDARR